MRKLSFRQRRNYAVATTLLAVLLFAGITWVIRSRLGHASIFTGATLLVCLLGLVLIGVRRRLPILPLGNVSTWTQVHLYTGFFSSAIYWLHVPNLIGDGFFECALSLFFLIVTLSGFYGIYASRTLPKRLTSVQGQHRFDRVSWHRDQISTTARGLLDELGETSAIRVLGNFYTKYLHPFFNSRPSLTYVLVPTGVRRRRLLSGLRELDRYMETEGRSTSGKLAALVRRRDDLDYQFALQLRLRLWVVVHSFLSIVLVVAAIAHTIISLRYLG
ncbi:hypothetical protein Pla22_20290 [Rubripirellula amarantea]|uniref:Ferric reductase like transmembrane component n=1 Tax=Rubripirellula amarantea TaxID=2527999 RepID=A0A5C5WWZ2_9BACT|nr:hypothetical protein [Rubripirellula amarantea]TWT54382.1 hypothetical protein Pla22_20290 [Rubripirellula amarantea]